MLLDCDLVMMVAYIPVSPNDLFDVLLLLPLFLQRCGSLLDPQDCLLRHAFCLHYCVHGCSGQVHNGSNIISTVISTVILRVVDLDTKFPVH